MADCNSPSREIAGSPISLEHYRTHFPIASEPTGETVKPPPEWAVEVSAYCLHCGYDLRGLPLGLPCSECGRPVDWSKHADHLRRYYRRTALRTHWDMLNFFCVLPHGLWAMDDPDGRGWAGRPWKSFGILCLVAMFIGMFLAGGVYVESRHVVWYERGNESTAPVTAEIDTKKFLGGWGIVARKKLETPVSPGADWSERKQVQRTLRLSRASMTQDGVILLALACPLLLAALAMPVMRRLILRFSAVDRSDPKNRRWLRERLYPAWLGFPLAAGLVAIGMTIQLSWSMLPVWVPDKVKELAVVWISNGAILVPPYFVLRILSADYTKRLFPNRWVLGGITLTCMVVIPWHIGQVLYWVTMSVAYPIGSPLARLPSLWPF